MFHIIGPSFSCCKVFVATIDYLFCPVHFGDITLDILDKFGMKDAKPVAIPVTIGI